MSRRFMAAVLGAAGFVVLSAGLSQAKTFVYVSAAEDGVIDGYAMDAATGALTPLAKTEAGKLVMPMTVSPDKKHLYAIVRSNPLSVVTYGIDPATGALARQATAPLPDSMPYVSTDKTGRFLFTASYGGDKIAVSPIEASGLVERGAIQVIPTGQNAHCIRIDASNKYVYATNLGSSQILQFKFDVATGKLTPNDPPLIKSRPGNGPRHIAFSPDGRFLYVVHELSGAVVQYAVDAETGTLKELDLVGSVPADSGLASGVEREAMLATATSGANTKPAGEDTTPRIWAADINIAPNGRFLYTSERTGSKISLLKIAPDTGKVTYVKNYDTEQQPRGFRIDPAGKYLVAAGEKSDKISVYAIDQVNGELKPVGRWPVGRDANWVEIVDLP